MIKIGKNLSEWSSYSCRPKTNKELEQIVEDRIEKEGNECDLNDIDTSLIEDMSWIFAESKFNGDISKWNTSKVKNMASMFSESDFNGDISDWDVSKVNGMSYMFARSKFTGDISKWDVSKVEDMECMFRESDFNKDISNWNIHNCNTNRMFKNKSIKDSYKPKSLQR